MFKDCAKKEEELRKYGLFEGKHFYFEKVFLLTTHFEAQSIIKVTESDFESDNYDAWAKTEITDKLHEEKDILGYVLLDHDFKPTTFEQLIANKHIVETKKDACGICGAKVIPAKDRDRDKRLKEGGLRCYDHIGMSLSNVEQGSGV